MGTPADGDMVTRTAWWVAPGEPQRVLAWAAAHLAAAYSHPGTGTLGGDIWGDGFTLPPVAGLFDQRDLDVWVHAGWARADRDPGGRHGGLDPGPGLPATPSRPRPGWPR